MRCGTVKSMPHNWSEVRGVHFRGSHRAAALMNALERHYVRKEGELIHVAGKRRFFEVGEVVESPRHLSPSHQAWTLAQLRYEIIQEFTAASREKRKRLSAELQMIKDQLSEMRRKSTPQLQLLSKGGGGRGV